MSCFKHKVALGFLCLGLAGAAGAEVLVLKDGSRVETRGEFEVRGRRVLFKDAQGTLAALRVDDVDLEASAAANAASAPEARSREAAPSPKRAPVLVLTDRDVPNADNDSVAAAPQAPRVVMYATSWCGYCRKARTLLGQLGVEYDELDIEKSAAARSTRDRLDPSCGVPLIDFGGEVVCGFAEKRIRQLAARDARRKAEAAAAVEARAAAEAGADGR
jgi:glutaredoxin